MFTLERPIVFFDLETTGTKTNVDRIVEIAMSKMHSMEDDDSAEDLYSLVNPMFPIPAAASEIHGITDEKVKGQPYFKELAPTILEFISGCDLGTFNGNSFDIPMLHAELDRAGFDWDYKLHKSVDVCNIFKQKEQRTLSAAVKFYLKKDHEGAHSGEEDVKATIKVFQKQLKKYKDLPQNVAELSLFCSYGKQVLDLAGKFRFNDNNEVVFAFGKWINQRVVEHKDYLDWMTSDKGDFTKDTKEVARKLIFA